MWIKADFLVVFNLVVIVLGEFFLLLELLFLASFFVTRVVVLAVVRVVSLKAFVLRQKQFYSRVP